MRGVEWAARVPALIMMRPARALAAAAAAGACSDMRPIVLPLISLTRQQQGILEFERTTSV